MTHLTQDKAYLKKLQLYIIFVERPVSSLILSTGLYFLLENGGKTMADIMVKPTCTTAYEITMKSTIVSALITLDTEKQMDERFWNHLRVQRNILDFLYALWLDDDRTLVDEFSTIIKDLVEYDFSIVEEQMKERLNIA